jgi:hypothetical protein
LKFYRSLKVPSPFDVPRNSYDSLLLCRGNIDVSIRQPVTSYLKAIIPFISGINH